MNKIQGYLIYTKNQTQAVAEFLKQADGCDYITMPAVEAELVDLLGGGGEIFNIEKAESILHRKPRSQEIAQTLSHIQCWKAIIENPDIAENDFVLIAEPTVSLVPHYFTAISNHVDSFLQGSHYQLALLQRSDHDDYWQKQIYSGEGNVNSIVFNLEISYNKAMCAMYLIRKSFIHSVLERLKNIKPHWLFYYYTEFCDVKSIVQLDKLLAIPHSTKLQKCKKVNKPRFSLIVPVYNVERYIEQAIESVLNQDFYNYEIILVNDGSTDLSTQICLEYSQKYPLITFINKPNGGPAESRNLGIKIARGEYLMFMDSDDYWRHTHVFSDLNKIIEKNDVDLIFTYRASLYNDIEITEHIKSSEGLTGDYSKDFEILVDRGIHHGYPFIKIIKREVLLKNNLYFPEGLLYEDVYWSYFVAKTVQSYALYENAYYAYRREREGAITQYVSPKKVTDMMSVFETCHQDLETIILRNGIYRGLKQSLLGFGDYVKVCYENLFEGQKEELKPLFDRFTKSLETLRT